MVDKTGKYKMWVYFIAFLYLLFAMNMFSLIPRYNSAQETNLLSLLSPAFFSGSAIGLFLLRRWGRLLALATAIYFGVLALVRCIQVSFENPGFGGFDIVMICIGLLIFSVHAAIFLFLRKAHVRSIFKR